MWPAMTYKNWSILCTMEKKEWESDQNVLCKVIHNILHDTVQRYLRQHNVSLNDLVNKDADCFRLIVSARKPRTQL